MVVGRCTPDVRNVNLIQNSCVGHRGWGVIDSSHQVGPVSGWLCAGFGDLPPEVHGRHDGMWWKGFLNQSRFKGPSSLKILSCARMGRRALLCTGWLSALWISCVSSLWDLRVLKSALELETMLQCLRAHWCSRVFQRPSPQPPWNIGLFQGTCNSNSRVSSVFLWHPQAPVTYIPITDKDRFTHTKKQIKNQPNNRKPNKNLEEKTKGVSSDLLSSADGSVGRNMGLITSSKVTLVRNVSP